MESSEYLFPECTPEQYARIRTTVEHRLAAAGYTVGARVPLVIDNEVRIYEYQGSAENPTGDTIPNCPVELCRSLQAQIHQICMSNSWRPGTPILVYDGDDSLCFCYCL